MTKEELKQQFYKYIKDHEDYFDPREPWTERIILQIWLDCAEPREKRIAELEEEVKEWKDKAELWCKTANLKDHNIMINKELEKENAELKERNRGLDAMLTGESLISNERKEQLTKAKEIIKDMLSILPKENIEGIYEITEEAEQFLKNSEVEK